MEAGFLFPMLKLLPFPNNFSLLLHYLYDSEFAVRLILVEKIQKPCWEISLKNELSVYIDSLKAENQCIKADFQQLQKTFS